MQVISHKDVILPAYEIILIVLGGLVGVALCIAVLVYYKLF